MYGFISLLLDRNHPGLGSRAFGSPLKHRVLLCFLRPLRTELDLSKAWQELISVF